MTKTQKRRRQRLYRQKKLKFGGYEGDRIELKIKDDKPLRRRSTRHRVCRTDRIMNWNYYMGNVWQGLCLICQINPVTIFNFDCAHVVARVDGGSDEMENLRPTCGRCNSQMGTRNLIEFTKDLYPNAPLLK